MFKKLTLVDNEIITLRLKAGCPARREKEEIMAGERATKMLILSSARTLFSEKGYDQTPVEEICELAGVAKGTFFYHFESKQYIVRYILAAQLQEYSEKIKEYMENQKDVMSKIEYFISELIEKRGFQSEPRTYFKDGETEWFRAVIDEERMHALYPLLENVVYEGIEQGVFRVKNPSVCARVAFLGIDAFLHKNNDSEEDINKGIREIAAKTLGVKGWAFAI